MPFERYSFNDDFQDLILACILQFPREFTKFGPILKKEYFTGKLRIAVAHAMFNGFEKYGSFPTIISLQQAVKRSLSAGGEEEQADATEYASALFEADTRDLPYVLEEVISFAKARSTYNALLKAIDLLNNNKVPDDGYVSLFEEALRVGQNLENKGYTLPTDIDRLQKKLDSNEYGIKTGYELLDNIWKRGWLPGWLIVPLAPPKHYKTAMCLNLVRNMATKYHADCLYYTCEISDDLAALRMICAMTDKSIYDFYENSESFFSEAKPIIGDLGGARIFFQFFPAGTATIAQIKAHAKSVIAQEGLNPRAIVIDYAETIKPSETNNPNDHRQQASIYTEARALGHELKACVIMPERCNRETVEQRVPTITSFQGAFQKAGIVDAAIGICATSDEYAQNILRFFIFLNRHGPAGGHFIGTVDPAKMQITIDKSLANKTSERSRSGSRPRGIGPESDSMDESSEVRTHAQRACR